MIKSLDDIRKRGKDYQRRFIDGCSMAEKVNAFVFHVRIVSVRSVRIYKSNHSELTSEEIILNDMWKNPIMDMRHILLSVPEFTMKHLGDTFSFLYFPVSNPLGTPYKEGFRYVLSFIRNKEGKPRSVREIRKAQINLSMLSEGLVSEYGVYMIEGGFPLEDNMDICMAFDNYIRGDISAKDFVSEILMRNTRSDMKGWLDDSILATDGLQAEGYIFRYGNDVYQVRMREPDRKEIPDNRISFEFLIHDFCGFLWDDEGWKDALLPLNYVKNVCIIFLRYINKYYNRNAFESYGVKPEDFRSPANGYYGGTCYEYIPNQKVRILCMNDPMMDGIFKVLLNGLRKPRKMKSDGMLILMEDNERWNECVSRIRMMSESGFSTRR